MGGGAPAARSALRMGLINGAGGKGAGDANASGREKAPTVAQELEAALKQLQDANTQEGKQQAFESLEKALKKLREQIKDGQEGGN